MLPPELEELLDDELLELDELDDELEELLDDELLELDELLDEDDEPPPTMPPRSLGCAVVHWSREIQLWPFS